MILIGIYLKGIYYIDFVVYENMYIYPKKCIKEFQINIKFYKHNLQHINF